MIMWLELFGTTEDADGCGGLHLGICRTGLLEFGWTHGSFPLAVDPLLPS
jgi:hypothetical protein